MAAGTRFLPWLLLLAVSVASAGELDKGVFFEERGQVLASAETWRVQVSVDVTHYSASLRDAERLVNGFFAEWHGLNLTQSLPEWLGRQRTTLGRRVRLLRASLTDVLTSMDDFSAQTSGRRSRRGLDNGVGDVFKVLFGFATEEDVSTLSTALDDVSIDADAILHLLTMQVSVLNLARQQAIQDKRNFRARHDLLVALKNQVDNVHYISGHIDNTLAALRWDLDQTSRAVLGVNALQALLDQLEGDLSSLKRAYLFARVGKLDPFFLPRDMATEILRKVNTASSLNVNAIYSMAEVTAYEDTRKPGMLLLLITFPVAREDHVFTVYRPLPLPTALPHGGLFFQLRPEADLIAVDNTRTRYFYMSNAEYDTCLASKGPIKVCNPQGLVHDLNEPSCLHRLLLNETKDNERLCNTVILKHFPPRVFRPSSDPYFVYSVPAETRLEANCSDEHALRDQIPQSIQGTGILRVPKGCTVFLDSFILTGLQETETLRMSADQSVQLKNVALPHASFPAVQAMSERLAELSDVQLEQLDELFKQSERGRREFSLENLEAKLEGIKAPSKWHQVNYNYDKMFLWLLTAIPCGILLLLLKKAKFSCPRRPQTVKLVLPKEKRSFSHTTLALDE